jgi:hypothetical protein
MAEPTPTTVMFVEGPNIYTCSWAALSVAQQRLLDVSAHAMHSIRTCPLQVVPRSLAEAATVVNS